MIAAIAHAELATLRPFTHGSYLVARASTRLILAAREVDVDGLVMSEYGAFLARTTSVCKGYCPPINLELPEGVALWIQVARRSYPQRYRDGAAISRTSGYKKVTFPQPTKAHRVKAHPS